MTRPDLNHPEELLPWLANGTLEGEELHRVEEHLRSCLACRREVEELRRLRREVDTASDASPPGAPGLERLLAEIEAERPRPHHRWFSPWQPMLAAAALMAAVGIGVWAPWSPTGPPVQERAGIDAEVLRPLVGEEEALPRQAFILRWQATPEWRQARFSVIVTAADLTPVAEVHGLEVTEYQIPPEALAALPSGARLFWRVEAVRPDGVRWRSQPFPVKMH